MGWVNNGYRYTVKTLQSIAGTYRFLYDGLPLSENYEVTKLLDIAEFKADFDVALESIGSASWSGIIGDYRRFGTLQRLIVDDILSEHNYITTKGKRYAYHLMKVKLNGG